MKQLIQHVLHRTHSKPVNWIQRQRGLGSVLIDVAMETTTMTYFAVAVICNVFIL